MAYTVTNNSPSAGSIAWTNIHIVYQGVDYTISNNSTNLKYVYWQLSTPTQLTASNTYPILGPNDTMVFFNRNGVATSVLDSTITDGALIVPGTITAEAISAGAISTGLLAANAVTTDKIAADSVTASKLLVTGQGKALNRDPACQDSSTWTYGGGPGTFSVVTEATSPVGSTVIRAVGGVQFYDQKHIPISAGTQYKVSMWARQTTGTGLMYLRLYCYDASNALVAYQVTGITPVTTSLEGIDVPATWTKYVGYITPPATSINAHLIVHVNWSNSGTTDCTDIRVEEYIGADLIVDGAISALKLAANSVVAGKIAAGAVEANTLAVGAVTANAIAAGAITTNKLAVVPNALSILPDPGLDDATAWDVGTSTIANVSGSPFGGKAFKVGATSNQIVSNTWAPFDNTKTYKASMFGVNTGTSTKLNYLMVQFADANKNIIASPNIVATGWPAAPGTYNYFGLVNQTPPSSWTEYSVTFGAGAAGVPTTARYVRIGILTNYNASAVGEVFFSGPRIQLVNDASLIVDGAITTNKLAANSVVAGKIAAGAISATEIAAGAITTSKLLVQPTSLCPDPYFADEAWWAGTLHDPLGWYYETGHVDRIQVPKIATLWSGHATNAPGGGRKHIWSGNVTVPPTGTQLRLRAIIRNHSNQTAYVQLRFYDVGGTMVGADIALTAAANSGLQTLNAIGVVPDTAATCRFIIYNASGSTFSGAVFVSGVMLDVAASADLIVDGAITAVKIAADTITGDKIAANAITASELATNAVTADKITAGSITTAKLATGAVTANEIAAGTITADKIAADTITGDKIAANTVTAAEIDSRGLSIKDASGNVILAAGTPLAASYITPAPTWVNNNLLNSGSWVAETIGAQPGFSVNPTSTNGANYIQISQLPNGQVGPVWVARSGTATSANPEGGFQADNVNIDKTKMYRWTVWIKASGNNSGSFYLGCNYVANLSDGTDNTNPYFIVGNRNSLTPERWYLFVGYTFPNTHTGTTHMGGVYDALTGLKRADIGVTSFKWRNTASLTNLRAYQFYTNTPSSPTDSANQFFWNPRLELCDGTEESIDSLLSFSALTSRNPITTTNASTYIAAAAIGSAQVGVLTAGNIAAGAITADKIGTNAIYADKIYSVNWDALKNGDTTNLPDDNANFSVVTDAVSAEAPLTSGSEAGFYQIKPLRSGRGITLSSDDGDDYRTVKIQSSSSQVNHIALGAGTDWATVSTTLMNVPGLTLMVPADLVGTGVVRVSGTLLVDTAATSTGIGLGIVSDFPVVGRFSRRASDNSTYTYALGGVTGDFPTTTGNWIDFECVAFNANTYFTVQARTEIASSAITIRPGSFMLMDHMSNLSPAVVTTVNATSGMASSYISAADAQGAVSGYSQITLRPNGSWNAYVKQQSGTVTTNVNGDYLSNNLPTSGNEFEALVELVSLTGVTTNYTLTKPTGWSSLSTNRVVKLSRSQLGSTTANVRITIRKVGETTPTQITNTALTVNATYEYSGGY